MILVSPVQLSMFRDSVKSRQAIASRRSAAHRGGCGGQGAATLFMAAERHNPPDMAAPGGSDPAALPAEPQRQHREPRGHPSTRRAERPRSPGEPRPPFAVR